MAEPRAAEADRRDLHLPGDPGLTIITYTGAPDSPTAQAVAFLASWSAREATMDAVDEPTRSTPDQR